MTEDERASADTRQAARPGIERARAWGRGGTFLLRRRLARVASHHRRVLHHDARSLVALEPSEEGSRKKALPDKIGDTGKMMQA